MADFESMREKHRKDSIMALSLFIFFILIYLFHKYYIAAFQDLMRDPSSLSAVLDKAWFIVMLNCVSPFVSYFLGILTIAKRDIYYDIDNWTLKMRKKVDRQICRDILALKASLSEEEKAKLENLNNLIDSEDVCRKIMRVFYQFIENKQIVNPQLKSNAFTYWGDYFSSLMYAFWGVLTIVGTIVIYISDHSISPLRIVILAILLFSVSLSLYSILKGRTHYRLFSVPNTQIEQIHRNAPEELLKVFRAENFFQ